MKRPFLIALILCAILPLFCAPLLAANHALLLGVGKYPFLENRHQLEGPAYDVSALKAALKNAWGFEEVNITTLVDEDATKEKILKALGHLTLTTQPGDSVFVYFSGHGTSGHDPKNLKLGIDPFTGALVPADFRIGNVNAMKHGLIIGNRDLKPILKRLDKDRRVLAVFDACYSGNTLRRALRGGFTGKAKHLPIDWEKQAGEGPGEHGGAEKAPPYPYTHVVSIAASSMREIAIEITSGDILSGNPTFDGLPHGALTDALLKGLHGDADTNRDNAITHGELYEFVRNAVSGRFPHTPRLLYPDGNRAVLDQPLFGQVIQTQVHLPVTPGPLRVKLEGVDGNLAKMISEIKGITVTQRDWDILVTQTPTLYSLYLPNGYFLADFPLTDPRGVVKRLSRQVKIKDLVNLSRPVQAFNVFVDLSGPGGVLVEGESVGFKVRTDQDAHILLINIDPTGFINVIYPFTPEELTPLKAGKELDLSHLSRVVKPFGTELVKVFAFRRRPPGLLKLMGGEFPPDDERFSLLMNMVRDEADSMAQATLRVKTCGRGEVE